MKRVFIRTGGSYPQSPATSFRTTTSGQMDIVFGLVVHPMETPWSIMTFGKASQLGNTGAATNGRYVACSAIRTVCSLARANKQFEVAYGGEE